MAYAYADPYKDFSHFTKAVEGCCGLQDLTPIIKNPQVGDPLLHKPILVERVDGKQFWLHKTMADDQALIYDGIKSYLVSSTLAIWKDV